MNATLLPPHIHSSPLPPHPHLLAPAFPSEDNVSRGYQLHQKLLCELGSHYLLAASSLNHWFHLIDKKIWQPWVKIFQGNDELETTVAVPLSMCCVPSKLCSFFHLATCLPLRRLRSVTLG